MRWLLRDVWCPATGHSFIGHRDGKYPASRVCVRCLLHLENLRWIQHAKLVMRYTSHSFVCRYLGQSASLAVRRDHVFAGFEVDRSGYSSLPRRYCMTRSPDVLGLEHAWTGSQRPLSPRVPYFVLKTSRSLGNYRIPGISLTLIRSRPTKYTDGDIILEHTRSGVDL